MDQNFSLAALPTKFGLACNFLYGIGKMLRVASLDASLSHQDVVTYLLKRIKSWRRNPSKANSRPLSARNSSIVSEATVYFAFSQAASVKALCRTLFTKSTASVVALFPFSSSKPLPSQTRYQHSGTTPSHCSYLLGLLSLSHIL